MAGNKQRFTYEINADIGQAKKAISDLQQSIEKLSKAQINTNYLDKGINNAVTAAKELEYHLSAALNQNTGKLNLNAFTSSLEQSNISAKDLMQTLLQGGSAGQQTFASLANAIAQSEVPLRRANKTLQDFTTTLKNTVKWEISSTMVHGLESALSGAVSYAKNLNTSLTNIRIVTGQSVDDMARFAKEANVAAKALSTTTKAYADASLIYYQQGDSAEMAAKKAAITIKAANSSFETSAKEMSEYLTSVWNSYQVGADELERYVDIMANLGAKTATSLEEIATSMQKVAATANTVGVSMEQVSSIIATVSSVTRESAESIGTSYKTIFARIGDLKLGGVDEDGVGLGQVSSQLDAIGVKILDESGNLREMGDIIMDLGTKWQTMNQAQKTAVAQVVAGKRQYTQLMALFENWDMFQGNMNIAENSEGALQKMADTYAESWEAASARVQASMEGIYNKILNDQAIITITNGIADLIGAVDTLIERLGGMSGMLSTLGGIGINVFSKQIAGGINKTVSSLKTYFSQFSGFGDFVSKGKNGQILNNEQINYQKSLADWDKAIDEVKSKQGEDSPEALALQNSKDLLDMKQQLINAEYSLSDAEKSRAQQLIAQQSAEQERLLSLRQERESLQKDLNTNAKKLTSNIVGTERGQGVAASATRESLKKLGLEQTITDYTKKSQQNAFANSLASYYDNRRDEYQSTKAQQAAVAEIKKQLTDRGIDAHIIDDLNDDLDTALQKVRQIQQQLGDEADSMADDFIDKMDGAGFAQKSRDQVSKMFADITDTTGNLVDIEFNEKGTIGVLNNIKEKFNSLFGKDSELMKSLGDKLTAAAGTIASMQGGFESGASWIEVWNDETAGFGDHLAAASGILTNLASGFAAGGPWGLALTAVMAIVGGIIQAAEEAQRAYQEAQQADYDKIKEEASKKDAELSNIQNLIKNYNSLKETYDTTGQGQEALAASARELAEAYGLVGANVLIAEGNFAAFEQMIAQSTGLKGVRDFYSRSINNVKNQIMDQSFNSQYRLGGKHRDGHFGTEAGSARDTVIRIDADDVEQALANTLYYNSDQYRGARKTTQIINDNFALESDYLEYKENLTEQKNNWAKTRDFASSTLNTGVYFDEWHTKVFNNDDIQNITTDIDNYFKDVLHIADSIGFSQANEKIAQIKTELQTQLAENDNVLSDPEIRNFTTQYSTLKKTLINDLINFINTQLEELTLDQDKIDSANKVLIDLKDDISSSLQEEMKEQVIAASGLTPNESGDFAYTDYFQGLVNADNRIDFSLYQDGEMGWYRQFEQNWEALNTEKANITKYISENNIEEDSKLGKYLQNRLNQLENIAGWFNELKNDKFAEGLDQIDLFQTFLNTAEEIDNVLIDMLGHNELDTNFSDFITKYYDKIKKSVEASALTDTRFEGLVDTATGGALQGKEEEFNKVRDQIIEGYISDWTAFDDYLSIYQSLAAVFSDKDKMSNGLTELENVSAFIRDKGITDAKLVNSILIQSIQKDFKTQGTIGDKTKDVLKFNRQNLSAQKNIEQYQSFNALAESYKDDLNYDEAFNLQKALIKEGDIAWQDFVNLDADARKNYLESRRDSLLQLAITGQRDLAEEAIEQQKNVYSAKTPESAEALYQADKTSLAVFEDYYEKKDGKWINKNTQQEARAIEVERYDAIAARTIEYENAKKIEEEAEAAKRALELVAENEDRAITKINRLKNAISELPKDMEEFNKLVKQLGNIEPKKLVEMSDLERAKLILSDLQKPTEAQFTTIDPETQKEVFNAAGYAEAMQAYEEARQSAVDVILESANAAFTQIENRMNHAREEAEKIQSAAQILSDSIATGELTETQKIKIPENFLTDWEAAADASERAAVAMRMWNESARQQEEAANEILTTYGQASKLLYLSAHTLEKFNFSDEEQGKIDFARMLSESNMDEALMDVWLKAWDNVKANGKDFTNMSNRSIIETLRAEINNMTDLTEEQKKTIFASVADNMTNLFTELSNNTIEEAEKATQAWLNAFDAINKAKRTLMSGGNLAEQIAGNPEEFMRLMQNSNHANNPQEFYNAVMSGQITADNLGMKEDFPYQALYESKIGNSKLAKLYQDYQSIFNVGEVFNEMGYFSNRDMAQQTIEGFKRQYNLSALTPDEMNILYNTLVQAHKDDLVKQLGYTPSTDNKGKLIYKNAEDQIIAENVLKQAYMSAVTPLLDYFGEEYTEGDFDNIFFKMMDKGNMLLSIMELSTKAYQEQAKQQNTLTEVEHKADINNLVESQIQEQKIGINGQYGSYEEYQRLQEAIERAQEAKYSGESWESLSAEDQDILKQYNINFDNVDTSAQNCANALAACAQAAYALAEQALLAEGTGYTKEDGKYYYTTEDGIKAEVTAENNEAIKALQEAQNFANNASFEAQDTNYQTIERMASSVGMTADKFDQYAETLYKVNGGTKEFNELSATEKQELRDTARLSQMAAEGWKELKESQEDNIKTIKKGDKTTTDYYKSLSDLTTSVKKAFGGCEAVTEDFVESHMDDIEKMAKGDIEAAERIESALLMEDLGEDVFNREVKFDVDKNGVEDDLGTIGSMLSAFGDEWRDKPIGFEATLDNTPALAGLQQLLDSGYMTVDQMNAALATIGWAPEIEYEVIQASDQQEALTVGSLVAGSEVIKVDGKIVTKATGQIAIPKIKSARKTGGGSSGASRPSSGGKGGGGGSKTPEKKDKVRGRDEIERYHKQNDTIDRLASSIEKIDKLKDRAYGKDHIAQIEAETDALNKQLIAQQDLHDEALKWMAADKADLVKYGAEYDENGTISNYETVMERIIDEYNSAIERYNNSEQGDGDKLALKAAEQIFEDAKKAIENYEEALSIANDSANEMLEIQNKLSEIEVEKIVYELELKVDLNERDLELLQYYQDKYTETLDKQDEIYNTILGSMLEYEDNLKALGEAYEELNNKRALGLITEADYAEAVQDLQDQIIDNLSELNDIQNQLVDTYTETLALAREEVERTTDTIDSANTALQSYMEILALSGNEKDYEKMATFYEMMNENNLTKIEIQRNHLDALLEEEDKFQEKIRSGQQLTDLEKEQYQALQEEIFETRDALLSTTQEALNTIRETYENTINSIADNLDNFMADAAGSMAYLQEQYGYFQEEQERYVSTAKELYEVSKLNRDIEKTLGETTSKAAKEALKALQEKINKQSELNELTEYDIEMNQLQYQLLLARIKLEETQNAKDVVRLTRDENGNYAYRYTANQDKIDEAAQNYEDVLQQINDSTVQRTSEIEQQLLNTMSNYKEKFQEIATDYTLTEEERLMKLEELNNNFAETMQFIQEQNAIATENLTANQEAIAEHYGVNMSQITASTAGNVNETIQSMIDKTQDYINAMNEAIFGEEGGQTAWQKYLAGVGDITDAADVAYGTMIKDAEEMGEMNNWSAEQAQEVIDTLTDTLEPLEALTNAWNSHNAILEATISNYESLAEVIQGVLAAVGEIPNTTGTGEADGTSMPRFAKGGPVDYTGLAWVDGTPGNPEYVLNPGDTQNILMAAATVKSMDSGFLGSLVESVKSAAHAMMNIFSNAYHAVGGVHTASTTLDQNVHITAEFPNVTDHNEIEEALLSLTNRASQFANQKK